MDYDNLKVLKLHDHPNFLQACCQLLNREWPRSERARLIGLNQSNDHFPMSLILINSQSNQLLGHVKLRKEGKKIFIESLIIDPIKRGYGLGSYFLKKVEQFIKNQGYNQIILTTIDKVKFYLKHGYVLINQTQKNSLNVAEPNDFVSYDNIPEPPPFPKMSRLADFEDKSQKILMKKQLID